MHIRFQVPLNLGTYLCENVSAFRIALRRHPAASLTYIEVINTYLSFQFQVYPLFRTWFVCLLQGDRVLFFSHLSLIT